MSLKKTALLPLILLVSALATGQTTSWEEISAAGRGLQDQGRYPDAEIAFRSALEQAERSGDPLRLARSLTQVAVVLRIRGDLPRAEGLFRRAIALLEKLPSPQDFAVALSGLARLYVDKAQYDNAEPLCRRTLEILAQGPGPEGAAVASALEVLVDVQIGRGQFAKPK